MLSQAASGLIAAEFPIGPTKIQLCQLRNQVPMNARQQRVPIKCSVFRNLGKKAVDFFYSPGHVSVRASLTGFSVKGIVTLVEGFTWKEVEIVPFLHWLLVLVKEGLKCYLLARMDVTIGNHCPNHVFSRSKLVSA